MAENENQQKDKKKARKKNKLLPVILISLILVIVGTAVWFLAFKGDIGEIWAKLQDYTSNDSAVNPVFQDEPATTPVDREDALEECLLQWLSWLSGESEDNFILLETSRLPDQEEYSDIYGDDMVVSYEVEESTEDSSTVLIGEPYYPPYYRLYLQWQNNKWEITREQDLG